MSVKYKRDRADHTQGSPIRYVGMSGGSAALMVTKAARDFWARDSTGPVIAVVAGTQAAESLLADVEFLCPKEGEVQGFPGWEVLPFDGLSPTADISAQRLRTLYALLSRKRVIVVVTIESLMQRLFPPELLSARIFALKVGEELDRDELTEKLFLAGYQRSTLVEEVGQVAVRGAVVDFFPPGTSLPLRAELFGDIVESLRLFDPGTQRSVKDCLEAEVLPVRELFSNLPPAELSKVLRARASELSLPQAAGKGVEEALLNGVLWPGIEHLQPLFLDRTAGFFDFVPEGAPLLLMEETAVEHAADDFERLTAERAARAIEEARLFPPPEKAYAGADEVFSILRPRLTHSFGNLDFLSEESLQAEGEEQTEFEARQRSAIASGKDSSRPIANRTLQTELRAARHSENPFKPLAREIERRLSEGSDVAIVVFGEQRVRRIQELLEGYEVDSYFLPDSFFEWREQTLTARLLPQVVLLNGRLSSGFRVSSERYQVISERELFPEIAPRPAASSAARSVRRFLGTISQLTEGDYIVHLDYGIGLYRGLTQLSVGGKPGDFLELEYAEGSKLYLPVENIGRVQKYSGAEGKQPQLTKLGGKTWEKTKQRVKKNVAELAGALLETLAAREISPGFSFGPVDTEDLDFADSFPFEETPDQQAAIEAVLNDMASERPMDRLVCGDVGYGKTEVALRAAFKAANSGKQTAVLVPTTVLADQHYQTFKERFQNTAARVGCVSRFFTSEENKQTLRAVAEGRIDIVIGTHRLLQRDVLFKDLGLLIIDEEHRFGVAHKEKLKRYRAEIDVLTLTATPIPRTLHLSLSGIRDLSLIATPPVNRRLTRTYLAPYNGSIVREAIARELSRGGQVFYIHNRVGNIGIVADEVRELVPEARVAVGHGQMPERELEQVMHSFIQHEVDVLVSTTIVESGLDIPNANTIIIRNADRFGLAELYQLRGRVGRSSRRAYAYLLVSDPKSLNSEAKRRLQVLQSLDDLGVGFRLALQDMEIRGAGNLLGKDQSGHINLVGYELYSRILNDAVVELRRRREQDSAAVVTPPVTDPDIHIGFPAHIPPPYIPDVAERLLLYQRLIEIRNDDEARDILSEIEDRFGRPPEEVYLLLELMALRALLKRAGITKFSFRDGRMSFSFHPEVQLDPERVLAAVSNSGGRLRLSPSGTVSWETEFEEVEQPRTLQRELERVLPDISLTL